MSVARIFAKSDPIFKMIFGDLENKTALIGLLSKIIDIPKFSFILAHGANLWFNL